MKHQPLPRNGFIPIDPDAARQLEDQTEAKAFPGLPQVDTPIPAERPTVVATPSQQAVVTATVYIRVLGITIFRYRCSDTVNIRPGMLIAERTRNLSIEVEIRDIEP